MPTPTFRAMIYDLTSQALAQAKALAVPGLNIRPWQIPETFTGGTDPQDPAGFMLACDRTDTNEACVEAYTTGGAQNAGRLGQLIACKQALDYQAAAERALHARHASGVRCRTWAAARRLGHGTPVYGVFAAVERDADKTYAAGTATDN